MFITNYSQFWLYPYPVELFPGDKACAFLVHVLEAFKRLEQLALRGERPGLSSGQNQGAPVNVLAIRGQVGRHQVQLETQNTLINTLDN